MGKSLIHSSLGPEGALGNYHHSIRLEWLVPAPLQEMVRLGQALKESSVVYLPVQRCGLEYLPSHREELMARPQEPKLGWHRFLRVSLVHELVLQPCVSNQKS